MRLTPKQLVYFCALLTALMVAVVVFCVSSCTIAPKPVTALAANNSPTGQDSGIMAVKDGKFWVSAYWHVKYLGLLDLYETRLRALGQWPDGPEDGITAQPDNTFLVTGDAMERNNRMAEWTRDAQSLKP